MSSQIAEEHSSITIGEIASIVRGTINPNHSPDEEFTYYSIPGYDATGGALQTQGREIQSNKTLLQDECILISKLNPRIPRVCLAAISERNRTICSTEFIPLVPKRESVFPEYLTHYLRSPVFQERFQSAAGGSTNSHSRVTPGEILDWEVFIPPLPEQKKIAEILSGIDRCINLHAARLQVLQNIQNALFDGIPKKKDATHGVLLGDIIDTLNSGWSPVCPPQARTGSAPAILKTTAITWDGYKPEENKSLPSELTAKDEAIVQPGDILCTRKGPRDRAGVVCYVSDTPPNLMVPDTAFRIRISDGNDPHYIALVLGSKEVQEEWNRKKVGLAEAQVNINHGILKETHIPLPPREMQLGLVNAITKTRERIGKENAKILSLQVLKCSLASDLLSGRKRVSV